MGVVRIGEEILGLNGEAQKHRGMENFPSKAGVALIGIWRLIAASQRMREVYYSNLP